MVGPRVVGFKHMSINLDYVTHVQDMVEETSPDGTFVRQVIVRGDDDYNPDKEGNTIEKCLLVSQGQNYQFLLRGGEMGTFIRWWSEYLVNEYEPIGG